MRNYLEERSLFGPLIDEEPDENLGLVVVIPCYDEPDLLKSLNCLWACIPPRKSVEVIVVINDSEKDKPEIKLQNEETLLQAKDWAIKHQRSGFHCYPVYCSGLSAKHAGVGLARKIGLDEGCRRFSQLTQKDGILVFFDADSCCDTNFLVAIERYFKLHPDKQAVSIYFEHPVEGEDYPEKVYQAIVQYELHLRYFIQIQQWAGFPHAAHTIGSSMAVRSVAYIQQGGMNRRQAGEDFYFMHKFTPLGVHGNLNTTRVIPSPRPSHRVPFGTGKDIQIQLERDLQRLTYAPRSFQDLKVFLSNIDALWVEVPAMSKYTVSISQFLENESWMARLTEIQSQSASLEAFRKRFFRWFNAFRVMKFAHFAREGFYPDIPVQEAAGWLLNEKGIEVSDLPLRELLYQYRRLDRLEE